MTDQRLCATDFLNNASDLPILDVRSPAEYEAGHIPGALSFPLFSNEERAIVGTLYKQQGRQTAIKKGLEIVGPKMIHFVEAAEKLSASTLALYCWRGGMRSDSMAWLLRRYGFKTLLLDGGYKAFRNARLEFYQTDLPLHVIAGYTGSQKTRLLHLLAERGAQVIDLEGLAGHQGSSFGNKKSIAQPTSEHFQNLVFFALRQMDTTRPIWIEAEDMRIGTVNMTEALHQKKNKSPHYIIQMDANERARFLAGDYGELSDEKLIEATEAISKRLGYDRAKLAIEHIRAGEREQAARIILYYYDKAYDRAMARKKSPIAGIFETTTKELPDLADTLINITQDGI